MTGIDRDAVAQVFQEHSYAVEEQRYGKPRDWADRVLALVDPVEPVAFTRDRVRTELLASLPADPKWATWVEGVLDRLEADS